MVWIGNLKIKMQVSVIIPTYNEAENLPNLLDCLKRQTFRDFEIIVADNKSTDETCAIAEKYGAKVVEGGLPAEGRNNGARHAQGEILVFLDADALCGDDFLEKNIRSFVARMGEFAMPRIKTSSGDFRDKIIFGFHDFWLLATKKIKPFTMGFSIFIRRDIFEKINGFDEKMNLGEDADLGFRLKKAGFRFVVLPSPILVSARRFIKHGRVRHSAKMIYCGVMQIFDIDPNRRIEYGWGYEKKDKSE